MKRLLLTTTFYLLAQGVAVAQSSESQAADETPNVSSQSYGQGNKILTPESGLEVIETWQQNRRDRVEVHHKRSGMRHVYDFNNPARTFEDRGISERRMMGTWQFGGR